MENFVNKIIEKLNPQLESEHYDTKRLEKSCVKDSIPKEFFTENKDDIEDELKAFTLGCELFKDKTGKVYEGDHLERIQEVKEAGVYQFLQATIQDEVGSIISDVFYLKRLLELNSKDKETLKRYSNKCFNMEIDNYSTVGLVRDVNQDNLEVYQKDELLILVVADGVGGGEDGDVASRLACKTSIEYLSKENYNVSDKDIEHYLSQAIIKSHENVTQYAKSNSIETIGTTLSIALIYNKKLFVGHVGDSRIYRINNEGIEPITHDHSLPEVLFRKKDISKEEKDNYKKNILVYVVGKKDLEAKNLHVFTAKKHLENETLFLCSDGIWDIDDGQIVQQFDKDIKELKATIMESIPADNATFIRCTFKAKNNDSFTNTKSKSSSNNIHIDCIEVPEEPSTYVNKVFPILFTIFMLGIGYFIYDYLSSQTTTSDANKTITEVNTSVVTTDVKKIVETNVTLSTNTIKEPYKETVIPDSNNDDKEEKEALPEVSDKKILEEVKKDTPSVSLIEEYPVIKKAVKRVSSPTTAHSTPKVIQQDMPKSKIILDTTSYKHSDILTIDEMKIFFSEDKIMSNKSCFGVLHTNKKIIRCKIKKRIINPEYVNSLTKQKFAKSIKIRWHKDTQESHIVVTLNDNYKFVRVKKVNAPDHVEDIIFKKINKKKHYPVEAVKKEVKLVEPRIKHWSDGDALYLDDTLITFKRDVITLTGEGSSCHQDGAKWICIVLNKRVKYKNITSDFRKQEFAETIELSSYNSPKNTRIVVTLKKGYTVSKESSFNNKCILTFKEK